MEEGRIRIFDFVSGNTEEIYLHTPSKGHSGSDERMMHDFVQLLGNSENSGTDRCRNFCRQSSDGTGSGGIKAQWRDDRLCNL